MMIFPIGTSGQRLVFSESVLKHFDRHRQLYFWQREAGGQLFARFMLPEIAIEEATGPRPSDRRGRYGYQPDRQAEQREIFARHQRGLHFVGDWHSHPEDRPAPSGRDRESMRELVTRSSHSLNGFVLAIIGRGALPDGLSVSLFDRRNVFVPLHPMASEGRAPANGLQRTGDTPLAPNDASR